MERQPIKRSSLFLLELMIAIFFFCIASAVCIRLFVWSDHSTKETEKLNHAMNQVSAAAELLRSHENTSSVWKSEYPDMIQIDNNHFYIYYDDQWQQCKKEESYYHMDIVSQKKDTLITYTITMKHKNTTIYSIKIKKCILEKGDAS